MSFSDSFIQISTFFNFKTIKLKTINSKLAFNRYSTFDYGLSFFVAYFLERLFLTHQPIVSKIWNAGPYASASETEAMALTRSTYLTHSPPGNGNTCFPLPGSKAGAPLVVPYTGGLIAHRA